MNLLDQLIFSVLIALDLALLAVPLEFSTPLSDIYAVTGSPLWWTCSVLRTGQSSRLTFVWRFQHGDIGDDRTRINYGNGTLYFPQVLSTHIGQYTCTVSDSQSAIESSAYLRQAYISNNVLLQPRNQSVALGNSIALDCKVDGQPVPSFNWTMDGVSLIRTSRVMIIDAGAGHSILQISNVSYTDSGSYICKVNHVSLSQPLSSLPAVVRVYGKPVITSVLQDQSVPVNYNVTFYCQAQSEPRGTLTWFFNSGAPPDTPVQLYSSQPSVAVDDVSGTLRLFNVDVLKSGVYSCTWSNAYGSAFSKATLTVNGQPQPPMFVLRPNDATLVEGNDLRLSCSGTGNPKPNLTWINGAGNPVAQPNGLETQELDVSGLGSENINDNSGSVTDRVTIDEDGSLTVRNVSSSDIGIYICRLVNPVGEAESRVFVNVLYKPNFIASPQDVTVNDGSPFNLSCVAVANPLPTISWTIPASSTFNLTSVNSGINSYNNEIVLDNGDLRVSKANKAHRGVFTCFASNNIGSSAASAQVSVSGVPYFSVIPVSQGVIEGDSVVLQCQVEAYPAAEVYWYYRYMMDPSIQYTDILQYVKESVSQNNLPTENMTLLQTNQDGRYSFVNGTSLQFEHVQGCDAGLYLCLASNFYGSAFEPAILRVITFPVFQVKSTDTKVAFGSTVRLDCLSVGIPVPSQRWIFNQRTVELNSRKMLYINGSLLIENVQESDLGIYTCLATNQAGQRSFSASLSFSKLPNFLTPPSNATAVSGSTAVLPCRGNSSTFLEVSWYLSDPDGNPTKLLGLTVVNTDNKQLTSVTGESRIHVGAEGDLVFECLENSDSSWYICSLRNSDGNTPSSPVFLNVNDLPRIMSIEAPEKVFLGQIANLTCEARGSPIPNISWLTPTKVEYTEESSGEVTVGAMETSQFVQSTISITNLQMDRDAGVWTCKACNSVGCRLQRITLNLEGRAVIREIIGKEYDNGYFISCITAGIPAPNITYTSEGIPITNLTDGHTVINDDLLIQKDKIKLEYTCQAVSSYGPLAISQSVPPGIVITSVRPLSNSFIVSLSHLEPIPYLTPNKILLFFAIDDTNIWQNQTFYFSHDTGDYLQVEMGAITNNDTDVSCENEARSVVKRDVSLDNSFPEGFKVSITSTGTHFVFSIEANLQNLKSSTAYLLQAAVANILGIGPYSQQVSAKTLAAAPSPVTNVSVTVYNRTATVSWTKPDPLNGLPVDTNVIVQLFNSSSTVNSIDVISINVLQIPQVVTFSFLQPGDYNLKIIVSNRQTNTTSNVVTASFQVQDQPPSYRTQITVIRALTADVILLNWTVPLNPSTVFPPVAGYTIEVSIAERNDTNRRVQQLLDVSGASVSYSKIQNLLEHTTYFIRLASRNSAGIGPYSDFRNVTTPFSEFSEDALSNSTPWRITSIVLIIVCAALIVLTVVVIIIHQTKIAKSKSVDLDSHTDTDVQSNNNVEEEMQHDETAQAVEGHENRGFILY